MFFKDKVHLPLIALGTAMAELERVNKKIELVNIKIEEKQKRLSKFTFALEELSQSSVVSLSDTNVRQAFLENSQLPKKK